MSELRSVTMYHVVCKTDGKVLYDFYAKDIIVGFSKSVTTMYLFLRNNKMIYLDSNNINNHIFVTTSTHYYFEH